MSLAARNMFTLLRRCKFRVGTEHMKQTVFRLCTQSDPQIKHEELEIVPEKDVINSHTTRSHTCGELRAEHVGQNVSVCGWVQYRRLGKFLTLQDAYGATQLVVPDEKKELSHVVENVLYESVLSVQGVVQRRPKGQENDKMATGEVEVVVDDVEVLSSPKKTLPFEIRDFNKAKETLQLRYRYLALRFAELQHNLRLRSRIEYSMREHLCSLGFVDVKTPTLHRHSPGGAQEYVVPTQQCNQFYSLCQSPQLFKQMLMVGRIDRYYQIATCYRDEGARPDRQPEFTQVDVELSFTTREEIQRLVESLLMHSLCEDVGPLAIPFPQMTYHQAMEQYGTDKPDIRFEMKLKDVRQIMERLGSSVFATALQREDSCAKALVVRGKSDLFSNRIVKQYQDVAKSEYGLDGLASVRVQGNTEWQSSVSKHLTPELQKELQEYLHLQPGDLMFFSIGEKSKVLPFLGKLRLDCADHLEQEGVQLRHPKDMCFTWIVDFPLFVLSKEGKIESAHHPFTQPHPEDIHLIKERPLQVRGLSYDLVLNGAEIAGGSMRIHDGNLQRFIIKEVLKEDMEPLEYFLEALDYGCPPHGGIALGLDRLIATICNAPSIRDVIAFPKTNGGKDLMAGLPTTVPEEVLKLYHLPVNSKHVSTKKSKPST